MYVKLDKTVLHTNQFSVTRHQKSVSNINAESGMPGAFFSYELSPLMVKYTEKERSVTNINIHIFYLTCLHFKFLTFQVHWSFYDKYMCHCWWSFYSCRNI